MPTNTKALQVAEPAGFVAGKNVLLNSNMSIWQRATSGVNLGYVTADRWYINNAGGTTTSAQETTVVPAGFRYALKLTQSVSSAQVVAQQPIESINCIPFAGQTITISCYVAASASVNFTIDLGYSTSTDVGAAGSWTYISGSSQNVASTSYIRVTQTIAVPATAKSLMPRISATSLTSGTSFYITGVQMELGPVATPFTTATGTVQGELAACQRYYWRVSAASTYYRLGNGTGISTSVVHNTLKLPVTMRTAPTSLDYSNPLQTDGVSNFTGGTCAIQYSSPEVIGINYTHGSATLTQFRPYFLFTDGASASSYFGVSAEL